MVIMMKFTVPNGAVILQWPDEIDPEWLDFAREAIDIQINAIRRRGKNRKAADIEYLSWFPDAKTSVRELSI